MRLRQFWVNKLFHDISHFLEVVIIRTVEFVQLQVVHWQARVIVSVDDSRTLINNLGHKSIMLPKYLQGALPFRSSSRTVCQSSAHSRSSFVRKNSA